MWTEYLRSQAVSGQSIKNIEQPSTKKAPQVGEEKGRHGTEINSDSLNDLNRQVESLKSEIWKIRNPSNSGTTNERRLPSEPQIQGILHRRYTSIGILPDFPGHL